MHTVGITI